MQLATVHRIGSELTDGQLAVMEHRLPPRHLAAPLHRHSREDEISFVLAGDMGVLLGDQIVQAGAGGYVLKRRGQWHTAWNAGARELRFLELIVPGGVEECLGRLAPMLGASVAPPREVLRRVAAEYGIEFDFDSVAVLCRRFDLIGW